MRKQKDHVPSPAGPHQTYPQSSGCSHCCTPQQAPCGYYRNSRDLTSMPITCQPGLDLLRTDGQTRWVPRDREKRRTWRELLR